MSVFRRSVPLLATSFVNRCGTIGLSLLPMLLVEQQVGTGASSAVMTAVKGAGIAGVLAGGLLADRLGARRVVLLSFVLAGIGLGLVPLVPSLALVAVFAVVARAGQALFQSPARLLLTEWVEPSGRQEAIGWLRAANNAGLVVSFSLGALFSAWGVLPLMLFDSATSLAAAAVGLALLRDPPPRPPAHAEEREERTPASLGPATLCALAIAAFALLYDLFMVGGAALCRARYGDDGLQVFSYAMIINTLLCSGGGVWAARRMRDARTVFPLGLALVAAGALVALHPHASRTEFFLGSFILTLGEVLFTAMASFELIRLLPGGGRRGTLHGGLLVLQDLGRIAGAALAFPFVVHGGHPQLFIGVVGLFAVVFAVHAGRRISEAHAGAQGQVVVAP